MNELNLGGVFMTSVIQISKRTRQPRGGYLKVSEMDAIRFDDMKILHNRRHPDVSLKIIALAVDYLTHVNLGFDKKDIFLVSLMGAKMVDEHKEALNLLDEINRLEDTSIINACKLAGYDAAYRTGKDRFQGISELNPGLETIEDIRVMVKRSLDFFERTGPILQNSVTFESAYTGKVRTGEVDFLTEDAMWDLKILKHPVRQEDTLQILIYYLLGLESIHKEEFEKIKTIGIYNPRINIVYAIDVSKIDEKTRQKVYENVMGY